MEDFKIEIEQKFDRITMRLYENGIMNVIFGDNCFIDLRDIKEVVDWVAKIANGRKFVNLMEGAYNSDLSPEVREFGASISENKYTIADAILVSSEAHLLSSNFYVKFNKPVKPTKIFEDRSEAISWLLKEKQEYFLAKKAS